MEKSIPFFKSWNWKMLIFILCVSLLPLSALSIVSYHRSRTTIQNHLHESFAQTLQIEKDALRSWLIERTSFITFLASQPEIQSMQIDRIAPLLRSGMQRYENLDSLYVTGLNGKEIFDTDLDIGPNIQLVDLSDRPYIQAALRGETFISETVISRTTGNLILVITTPIRSPQGEIIGTLSGAITSDSINQIMGSHMGQTGESYLINSQGIFLTPSRFEEDLLSKGLIQKQSELELPNQSYGAQQALAGQTGVAEYANYRGIQVLGAYTSLDLYNIHWGILIEQETVEAYREAERLRSILGIFTILAAAAVSIIGIFLSHYLTLPIIQIREAALRLARGEVDQDITIYRDDEIGSMAEAFRQMIAYFRYIAYITVRLARGDLTIEINPQSEVDILGNSLKKMISDLRNLVHEDSLVALERKFNHLYHSALDGIAFISPTMGIEDCNEAFEEMTGYSTSELHQMQFSMLVPPEHRSQEELTLAKVFNQDSSPLMDREILRKDGSSFPVEMVVYLVRNDNGQPIGSWVFIRDVTERKQFENALRASEDRYRRLFEGATLGIFQTQIDGKLIDINQSLCNILGYESPAAARQKIENVSRLYKNENRRIEMVEWLKSKKGTLISNEELIHSDGSIRICRINMRAVRDDSGEIHHLEGFIEDITERVRVEKELNEYRGHLEELVQKRTTELEILNQKLTVEVKERIQAQTELLKAKESAEIANQSKSIFLANMSHELRTPLNAILGFSRLMLRFTQLTPSQQNNMQIIVRSGEHLLELINDILDLSKIEAGRMNIQEKNFDLYQLLANLAEMFTLRATEKNLDFQVIRSNRVPQYIRTDESKLRQILTNLLGNAMKFTERGNVILKATRLSRDKTSSLAIKIRFAVEDTGPGIQAADLEHIFDAFVQSSTVAEKHEGTGLGLAISKQYALLMGGNLTVSSEPGIGSTFILDLPVAPISIEDLPKEKTLRKVVGLAPGQTPKRILIVDDNPESRQLLHSLLDLPVLGEQKPVLELREAGNGREAIRIWSEWFPHLIFMDLRMPVMDGYAATRYIKSFERGRATIIIALTASAFQEDRILMLSEGCNDSIYKPYQEEEIFDKLSQYLDIRFIYKDEPEKSGPTEEATAADALLSEVNQLPENLLNMLQTAAQTLSAGKIREITLEIENQGFLELSAYLQDMVAQYNYDAILNLIHRRSQE